VTRITVHASELCPAASKRARSELWPIIQDYHKVRLRKQALLQVTHRLPAKHCIDN
jgi:hypothetical protein